MIIWLNKAVEMQNKITQAVLLSAGLGTRLKPLTDQAPKVMLPVGGKPLLLWHIERLKSFGVLEFFVNLFHLPDVIRNYFADGSKWGVKINYCLEEPEIRGTAGGIKDFDGKLRGDFFVCYGDVFNRLDFKKMTEYFYSKSGIIGMTVVGETDHLDDSDLAEVAPDMRFLKIYPKPHKTLPLKYKAMTAAAFIFNERVLKYIPARTYYEIDHQLLPKVLSRGEKFYGYETSDYIKDIGTTERYTAVEEYVSTNLVK